jgi:hypothetical protein
LRQGILTKTPPVFATTYKTIDIALPHVSLWKLKNNLTLTVSNKALAPAKSISAAAARASADATNAIADSISASIEV